MLVELKDIVKHNQDMMEEVDHVDTQLEQHEFKFSSFMNEQNQNTKVTSLKQEIQDMKKEINIMSIREGVIRNQVEN